MSESPETPFPRRWMALAWLAVVAGGVLRFLHIGRESLWFDEGYTAWMVNHSPGEILRLVKADTAPPLYYVLLHFWAGVVGTSEAGLRSMSAVCSVGTLILTILIARRLLANPIAVVAAAWIGCFSFLQVQYAQEARGYALMGFLIVAAFYCLLRHLAAKDKHWLVPIAIPLAAALYTHNIAIPYVVIFFVAWMGMRRQWVDLAIVIAIVEAAYGPWMVFLASQVHRVHENGFWLSRPNGADVLHVFNSLTGLPLMGGIPLVIFAIVRLKREALAALGLALLPPMLVAGYSLIGTPIFMDKLFIPTAALLPVLMMLPMRTPRVAWRAGLLTAVLAAYTLLHFEQTERKENWRGAAGFVAELSPARDSRLILFVANDGQLPFDYYYRLRPNEIESGYPGGFFDLNPPRTMRRVLSAEDLANVEGNVLPRFKEVILVVSTGHLLWADPNGLTLAMLRQRYAREDRGEFWGVTVYRFSKIR